MRIRILTITHKSPAWIEAGYAEYAKRLPPAYALELIAIPAEKRSQNADLNRIKERESEKMLSLIKPSHHIVLLDVTGEDWSTEILASELATWQKAGKNVDLLIGGPEGLSDTLKSKAHQTWSLSRLTFPHFLVRVIIAEQIYRAFTLLTNHPYHR